MQLTEQCSCNHDKHLANNDAHMQSNHVSQMYRVLVCIINSPNTDSELNEGSGI